MVRAGALGDLILLRPALASLRAAGLRVGLLAPPTGDILVGDGAADVDERLDWDHPGLAHLLGGGDEASPEAARLVSRLRSYTAAIAVTAHPDLTALLLRFIPDVRTATPVPPPGEHASEAPRRAALALGGSVLDAAPVLVATVEGERAAAPVQAALPERFLALHPGSGSKRKNWPAEHFLALVDRLDSGRPFLVVEGPADAEAARPFREHPRAVWARDLPLAALARLLNWSGLFVGNDSGVSHLAAACGAPTLALFGPTDPAAWAPLGPRVEVLQATGGDLARLEVEPVARRAQALAASA